MKKVIKGLKCCIIEGDAEEVCPNCPYVDKHPFECTTQLMMDALALLREQEPVKPKKALWIRPTYEDCHCSVCGEQPEHEPGESVPLYPYCPYCGAEMEVKYG